MTARRPRSAAPLRAAHPPSPSRRGAARPALRPRRPCETVVSPSFRPADAKLAGGRAARTRIQETGR